MPRIALGLEYDGQSFAGWQLQSHARTLQGEVEAALATVADHPVNVIATGRTDAGVHAAMQVLHFDTDAVRPERGWMMGANTVLPQAISVQWVRELPLEFHARYSALARSYRYIILNRMPRPALLSGRVGWVRHTLDAERMHRAAQGLLGEHDFSSFRAAQCQSHSPVRRLYFIRVQRQQDFITVDVTANAFLHHMVRNIVGVLIAVGRGEAGEDWPAQLLHTRNRREAGVTAPADGLYLYGVHYPLEFALPSYRAELAWPPGPVWPPGAIPARPLPDGLLADGPMSRGEAGDDTVEME